MLKFVFYVEKASLKRGHAHIHREETSLEFLVHFVKCVNVSYKAHTKRGLSVSRLVL